MMCAAFNINGCVTPYRVECSQAAVVEGVTRAHEPLGVVRITRPFRATCYVKRDLRRLVQHAHEVFQHHNALIHHRPAGAQRHKLSQDPSLRRSAVPLADVSENDHPSLVRNTPHGIHDVAPTQSVHPQQSLDGNAKYKGTAFMPGENTLWSPSFACVIPIYEHSYHAIAHRSTYSYNPHAHRRPRMQQRTGQKFSMQSLQTSNCPTHIEDGSRLPALKTNEGYGTFHPNHEVVIQGDQRNSHVRVLRSHNNARLLLPALNVVCA